MEMVICNGPSEKIQDETMSNHPEKNGVMYESANLTMPVPRSENPENANLEETINKIVSKETSQKSDVNEPTNVTDTLSQKSLSPTLIEHAFKVVKNIFSPDKNKSRPSSVLTSVSQQRCSSRSPRNSVFLANKSEFPCPSPEMSLSNPAETNLKGDVNSGDQAGLLLDTPNQDSHNNTNDSFLTTASLIEESFQSAVTHLEDPGDVLNCDVDESDILQNSRNLDLFDPSNDTLCSSECGLDNTMLKNVSLTSLEDKHRNNTKCSEEDFSKGSFADEVSSGMRNLQGTSSDEIINDTGEKDTPFKVQDVNKSDSGKVGDGISTIEVLRSVVEESVQKSEKVKSTEIIKTAHEPISESIDKSSSLLVTDPNELEKGSNIGQDKSTPEENSTNTGKIPTDFSESESEKTAETNISTTTIVLSESNTDFLQDALSALKLTEDSENSPPGFYQNAEKSDAVPKLLKEISPFKTSKTVNSADSEEKPMKKGSKSGGNTPNKHVKGSRNKLNKSIDSVSRKNLYNSPKGRKGFRQKLAEDMVLSVPKGNTMAESSDCHFFTTEVSDGSKSTAGHGEVNEGGDKLNYPDGVENSSSVACFMQDSNSLSFQQSYTILNTSDNNLKRPVINSFEDFNVGPSSCAYGSPSFTTPRDLEVRKTLSDLTNECTSKSAEVTALIPSAKQSTPELCGNGGNKTFSSSEDRLTESVSPPFVNGKTPNSLGGRIPVSDLEFSPVVPDGEVFHLVHSVEKKSMCSSSPRRAPLSRNDSVTLFKDVNSKHEKTAEVPKLNQTFDKKTTTPDSAKLNRTFDLKPEFQESNKGNETFEIAVGVQQSGKLNETFDIKTSDQSSRKLNETFDKNTGFQTLGKLNETVDLETETPAKMNCTFDLKSTPETPGKLNETFDKKSDPFNQTFNLKRQSPVENTFNRTFEKIEEKDSVLTDDKKMEPTAKEEEEGFRADGKFIQPKPCPTTIIDTNLLKADLPETLSGSRECLNSSFISTTSSNASLLCNGNVTVLINQGFSGSTHGLNDENPVGKNEDEPEIEEWSDTLSRPPSADEPVLDNENKFVDVKGTHLVKEDKIPCDPDLVQFIQEQFTSTDIEKICSVVEDFSMTKQSANETAKSIPSVSSKGGEGDLSGGKFLNPLSPHSFDFLSSIGGKASGRDWSRESLYVKFDPLVQGPGTNSLIDFTKEVEALESLESSPANETVVEHLLTISPQKKPDEIVPPLTPFSQRNKNAVREDKGERLKELQNEIYFLKNLYAERERINKSKMEEYESQITKLTGQSCILEDKLKESNERERSLVKKLQEQNQSLEQLKRIMEEYVKVITELTSELEKVKRENARQLATVNAEKESYVTHLQNTEAAFTDVHAKYEKSKKTIVSLKANEALFRQTLADQAEKMEEYKQKAKETQERACKEMQKLQEELNGAKANHSQETARLRALLRKTELKLEAVQESLDQKIKENQQLTAICDELIEGKK